MTRIGEMNSDVDVTAVATQWSSGEYMRYGIDQVTTSNSGQPNEGVMRLLPFFCPDTSTFTKIGVEINGSGTASSVARLGIYDDLNSKPDTLLLDAGTVDITSTGYKEITINQAVQFGMVWLAVVPQNVSGNPRFVQSDELSVPIRYSSPPTLQSNRWCFEQSGVTGALPATATATLSTNRAPVVVIYQP